MSGAEIAGLVVGIAAVCGPAGKLAKQLWVAYNHDEGIAYDIRRLRCRIKDLGNSIKFALECLKSSIDENPSSPTMQRLHRSRLLPDLRKHAKLIADQMKESYHELLEAEKKVLFDADLRG